MDLDLFAWGTAVGIAAFLCLLIFWWHHSREQEFERAFSEEALKILTQPDKKKGGKNAKKDKKKQKTPDETEDEREKDDKNTVQPQAAAARVSASPSAPVAPPQAKSKVPSPKQPQQQQQQQVQQAAAPKEQHISSNDSPKEAPKESTKEEKKKPVKVINPKDLDLKKVIARLTALTDLEDGYIQFLNNSFRDSDNQKNNLSSEVKALQKKVSEGTQKIEKLQKDKAAVEQREKHEQSQRLTLNTKLQEFQGRESELTRQLHAAQAAVTNRATEQDINSMRGRIQQLEHDNNNLRTMNSRTNHSLQTLQQHLKSEQNKNRQLKNEYDAEIKRRNEEKAKSDVSLQKFTKVVERVEAESLEAGQKLAQQKEEIAGLTKSKAELQESLDAALLALQNQTERDGKKDSELAAEITALKEENQKLNNEKKLGLENHARLEELIKELNNDISEFHAYKDQQEALISELKKREQSRIGEIDSIKERSQANEAELLKQLNEIKVKLAETQKALEEEKSRVVEIPHNNPEPVVEEVFELKKTHVDLASAPSTSDTDDAEVKRLIAENATLQDKNAELRQRNANIQEKVEAAPNQVLNERKRVVAEFQKLNGKQFKTYNDEEAYNQWFCESITDVQNRINASQSAAPTCTPVPSKVQKQAAPVQQAQPQSEGDRQVLQTLLKQLERISVLVDQSEQKYEDSIARLTANQIS
ncbi:hypothetical protein CAEBREN_23112 [Caenorhabditis brenneri]|uniref:Uncharacterized protein n=1 Tax=Caenorhabditis brenneri TaxID=135651 RepID=G0N0N5_CAEBE|nr:hypothetical protein CAEBREN_23112 [Caenorhabditis brenneri]